MPKQRLTCTRCSQRRQKCDRKTPCSRCVQNKEAHLCTTTWKEGYNPSVHRRYPRKPSSVGHSAGSDTSSTLNDSPSSGLQEHTLTSTADDIAAAKTHSTHPITGPPFTIGQSRFIDITIGSLLNEKDASASNTDFLDTSTKYVKSTGKQMQETSRVASFCSPTAKAMEIQHIQALLPSKEVVMTITDYYHKNMLYWMGGLYHGPSFRQELLQAYGSSDTLDMQTLDWKWTSLLFAILASGMIASPEALSVSWGYSTDDKIRLSREWGAACPSCLNLGNYTIQYNICSVQAIYVLHAYEHTLGSTNHWTALRSVSVTIAKGLGLHRLGPHPDDDKITELTGDGKQAFIDREMGRRIWSTICSQEWLCSTTQNSYITPISKRQFTSVMPMFLDEETMLPTGDSIPSFTLVGHYLYDYASLLLDYHNAVLDAVDMDEAARYSMILRFDGELRAISIEKVPKALSSRMPLNPAWPKWVKWARTLHQASINHKIIMIHQSFISKSFKDARYTYTRWACATAAKNVVALYHTRDPEEPQWWVEQAFLVTAALCLLLDLFHRHDRGAEAEEYLACVQQAIRYLQQFFTSSVALHGVRILCSLLQEYSKLHEGVRPPTAPPKSCTRVPTSLDDLQMTGTSSMSAQSLPTNPEVPLTSEEAAQFNFDIDNIVFEDLMEYLPVEGGLDNNVFLDSIYGLANGQFA